MKGWPPGAHRGLPDGALNLVISVGSPLLVRRDGQPDVAAAATVSGLSTSAVSVLHDGSQHGVQLTLTPRGSRALLGVPAAVLAERVLPLDEVIGAQRTRELRDRLAHAPGPRERTEVLDALLGRWMLDYESQPTVEGAWRLLSASNGCLPVAELARQVGLGRRHLGEVFRAEVGLAPKSVARILRFDHAHNCLRFGWTTGLAETAARCGFFDQAHLSNDWRQFAGCTVGQWLSEELPYFQDIDDAPGAGCRT